VEPSAGLPEWVDRCLAAGADRVLDAPERDGLRRLAGRVAPRLDAVRGARCLVHADFNPKNLMARFAHGRWTVTAVLDWEFAFSGSPLFDAGNMLRSPDALPPPFADGFVAGLRAGGAALPDGWADLARDLDLFSLADLLSRAGPPTRTGRPPSRDGHPRARDGQPPAVVALALVRARLAAEGRAGSAARARAATAGTAGGTRDGAGAVTE
jgi:Ser/Thr protein kinase RdoA (MazF antagonist)